VGGGFLVLGFLGGGINTKNRIFREEGRKMTKQGKKL